MKRLRQLTYGISASQSRGLRRSRLVMRSQQIFASQVGLHEGDIPILESGSGVSDIRGLRNPTAGPILYPDERPMFNGWTAVEASLLGHPRALTAVVALDRIAGYAGRRG
jgi:hypothetical protein